MVLQYFVPGFIFLYVFHFFTSGNNNFSSDSIIFDIVISYLLKSFFDCTPLKDNIPILCLFSLILSIISVKISNTKFLKNIFSKINHKTVFEDIWLNVIDYDAGTSLKFIYQDGTYIIGILLYHEEKGIDSWFILGDYIIHEQNEEYDSSTYDYSSKIAINLKDVKRVEIFNTK